MDPFKPFKKFKTFKPSEPQAHDLPHDDRALTLESRLYYTGTRRAEKEDPR